MIMEINVLTTQSKFSQISLERARNANLVVYNDWFSNCASLLRITKNELTKR